MAKGSTVVLGIGVCPVCLSDKCRFTLTSKLLVCVTCDGCNFQGFARSGKSDEILRGRIRPAAAPAPDPVRDLPPPAPVVAPVPPVKKSLLSW